MAQSPETILITGRAFEEISVGDALINVSSPGSGALFQRSLGQAVSANGTQRLVGDYSNAGPYNTGGIYLPTGAPLATNDPGFARASLNTAKIFQAALTDSVNQPVYSGAGTYQLGPNQLTIPALAAFYGHPLAILEFANNLALSSLGLLETAGLAQATKVNGWTLDGFWIRQKNTLTNYYSGLVTTDWQDRATVCSGDWTGLTVLSVWQTSAIQLFVQNTNLVYFDNLPPGYASLSAAQALVGLPMVHNRYLNHQAPLPTSCTIAAIALVTIGAWTGYQVTLNPPANSTYAVGFNSPGLVPAVSWSAQTLSSPSRNSRAAVQPPYMTVLSGHPIWYGGNLLSFCSDKPTIRNTLLTNCYRGNTILRQGDDHLLVNVTGLNTEGNGGSTGDRLTGGSRSRRINCIWISGDQSFQDVPSAATTNLAFQPLANKDIIDSYTGGGLACSLSEQPLAVIADINNTVQVIPWATVLTGGFNGIGNTLTMQGPLPNFITLAGLQASSATNPLFVYGYAKMLSFSYVDGTNVTYNSGTNVYTLGVIPPAGFPNAIVAQITPGSSILFSAGVPPYAMTCRIDSVFDGVQVISLNPQGAGVRNGDSQQLVSAVFNRCRFNNEAAFDQQSPGKSPSTIRIYGGAAQGSGGGIIVKMFDCECIWPYAQALGTSGNGLQLQTYGVDWGQAQTAAGNSIAMLDCEGLEAGFIHGGTVWANAALSIPAAYIGGPPGVGEVAEVLPNSTSDFGFSKLIVRGAKDNGATINWDYANDCFADDIQVFQASPLGTGNALAFNTTANTGNIYVRNGDYANIDGKVIGTVTSPSIIYFNGSPIFNPMPYFGGQSLVQSPLVLTPAEIAAQSQPAFQRFPSPGSNPSVTAFGQALCFIECSQTGTTASATITYPTGAFNGQEIDLYTNAAITSLTAGGFTGSLAAGAWVKQVWFSFTSAWTVKT